MKKILTTAMVAVLIMTLTACDSAREFYGMATGASLGGVFGSAIGGITGGRRGHDVGTIAGMVIGGAIGAAVNRDKPSGHMSKKETSSSDYYGDYDYDDYTYDKSPSPFANLEIENLRFVDPDDHTYIGAGSHTHLVFEIRNYGEEVVFDIAPVVTVSGTKEILLSPTAIVSELPPGRAVRYTADIVATKKLKNGMADFSIGFSDGQTVYTMRSFQLATRR